MATATYEIGNPNLSRERSQALDLGLAKTAGDTTWKLNAYHYRIKGYIYGAMAFSALVEGLNMWARRARSRKAAPERGH